MSKKTYFNDIVIRERSDGILNNERGLEQVAELFASTLLALEQQNNGIARFHAMRGMGLIEKIRAAENVRVVTRSESPLEGEKHFFTNHPLQEIKEDADQEQDTQSLAYADGRTKEASSGEEAT